MQHCPIQAIGSDPPPPPPPRPSRIPLPANTPPSPRSMHCRRCAGRSAVLSAPSCGCSVHPARPTPGPHTRRSLPLSKLSQRTKIVRTLINSTPALVVQTLAYDQPSLDGLDDWVKSTLSPFMEDVGTDPNAPFPFLREPLVWLQCIVLELCDAEQLEVKTWQW